MLRILTAYLLFVSSIALATDTPKELQAHFEKACISQKFMGAVSVAVNGKIVFSDACGWADAEWNVKQRRHPL